MINILPEDIKKQIDYSRRNVIARKYLVVICLIILVTGAALGVSHVYADRQIAEYEESLQERTAKAKQYKDLESSVDKLNSQIRTIEALLAQRPQFSVLLEDLAAVLPTGSYLNGIQLSEEIDQPLQLTITVPSQNQSVRVRNALLQSPHISSADIQSISQKSDSNEVNVNIIIAFNTEDES